MNKLTWMEKLHPAWSSASLIAESTESSFSTPLAFFLLLRFLELKIIKLLVLTFDYYCLFIPLLSFRMSLNELGPTI